MKWNKILALFCMAGLLPQLCACAKTNEPLDISCQSGNAVKLTANLSSAEPETFVTTDFSPEANLADFSVRLLQNCWNGNGENAVISPYSAAIALGMAANGAAGETLSQMEDLFGMSAQELSSFLYLCGQKARSEIKSANSIWLRDGANVADGFLQTNLNYYHADLFRAPFNELTVDEVNAWVSEQTNGRIEKLVDSLSEDSVMLLLNALSFDGVWESPFSADGTFTGFFQGAKGEQEVSMMTGSVWSYLDDGKATGFCKDYQNGYRFVALLPNEGVSMAEYLRSLSGSSLLKTLESASNEEVIVTMPKLDIQATSELNEALQAMGMTLAFGRDADLTPMGGDYFISQVLQKSTLKVDEEGTQAGVATMVDIAAKGAHIPKHKTVDLDRPFVLSIQDTQTGVFLFLGVIEQV